MLGIPIPEVARRRAHASIFILAGDLPRGLRNLHPLHARINLLGGIVESAYIVARLGRCNRWRPDKLREFLRLAFQPSSRSIEPVRLIMVTITDLYHGLLTYLEGVNMIID